MPGSTTDLSGQCFMACDASAVALGLPERQAMILPHVGRSGATGGWSTAADVLPGTSSKAKRLTWEEAAWGCHVCAPGLCRSPDRTLLPDAVLD